MASPIRIEIPRTFLPLVQEQWRWKVYYGGRGSAKSWQFARALLVLSMEKPLRVLCARELQRSIADSVHRLLSDQIHILKLDRVFEVTKREIRNRYNGGMFLLHRLRYNAAEIKSLEGIDICWVEEAEAVSEESWSYLIPTIRKPGSEIWVSFNPSSEDAPTWKRLVVSPPPDALVRHVTYRDNPWFPEVLRREMEHLRRTDPDAYAHIWEGKTWLRNDAAVLNGKWRVDVFEPEVWWDGPYFGADWGFAQDPTVLVKCWIANSNDGLTRLYIEREAYRVGVEMEDIPEFFRSIDSAAEHVIRADNARPETISYVARQGGLAVEAADKWPGSVEDGVAFLRSFDEIVIHERCVHTQQEARLYSYKTDRLTGDVLPKIEDKHNHCIDAIRYAIAPLIMTAHSVTEVVLIGQTENSQYDAGLV